MKHAVVGCLAAALVFSWGSEANGQSTTGEVLGTITDASGAVVPSASVEIREVDTGATRHTTANSRGDFIIRALPIGKYEISVESRGFKRAVRADLPVEVEQSVRSDFVLDVGAATETVSVSDQAPSINTEKGGIEARVLSDQMLQLPLNGRNPIELMNLNAGVDYGRSSNYEAVSGNRDDGSMLKVEGAMSTDVLGRSLIPILPLDAVSEFVIKTSVPGADSGFGNSSVSMAVKSGTNRYHGALYEFWRGNVADARDFFNPTNTLPPLVRNQYGGNAGGPILRNRTFFFVNVEQTRQASSSNSRATVPTLANRAGMFTGTIKDPLNTASVFPNSTVPSSRIDPLAVKILAYMPEPNLPGTLNNYYRQIHNWSNSSTGIGRIDQQLGDNQRIMLMARGNAGRSYVPGQIHTVGALFVWSNAYSYVARHDWVISPRLLNQASGSYFRSASISNAQLNGVDILSQFGLTGFKPLAASAETGFPDIRITGFPNLTDAGGAPSISDQHHYSVNDDLSWVRGNHNVKLGGSYYWIYLRRLVATLNRGQILYQGSLSGNAMADFLTGFPSQTSTSVGADVANETRRYVAGYLMDDWRITSRLTLNLGIRYELYTVPTEQSNRFASYDIPSRSLVVSSDSNNLPAGVLPQFLGPNAPLPLITTHQLGIPRGFSDTNSKNFAPRASFAYRMPGRKTTVLRGGYGWFYNPIRMDARLLAANNNAPFVALAYYQNIVGRSSSILNTVAAANSLNMGPTAGATLSMNGVARHFPDALNPQWNLTLERDLGWRTSGRISYVGNRGIHLPVVINYAQDFIVYNAAGVPRLDRFERRVNPVYIEEAASRSFYHALQSELRREFHNGISLQVNWTWHKLLSDAETDQSVPQDSFCLRCDFADAAYTRRHMVKFNFIYDLPFGPGKHFLSHGILSQTIGGWRLSGIGQWGTGIRFTPIYSRVGATDEIRAGRPNRVGDPNTGPHTVLKWFDTSAFMLPSAPPGSVAGLVFGNSARNTVVGPNQQFVNLSLQKIFRLREQVSLTLRLETFNAFNHTNFGSPALDLALPTAGVISSTSFPARQNQIGARIDF